MEVEEEEDVCFLLMVVVLGMVWCVVLDGGSFWGMKWGVSLLQIRLTTGNNYSQNQTEFLISQHQAIECMI